MSGGALQAIDRILDDDAGDADDVLRAVVAALVEEGACTWAGILFSDKGELVLGPEAGTPDPAHRLQVPVVYRDARVAELVVDGCQETGVVDRVALAIAAHCLVGWDTSGLPWDP